MASRQTFTHLPVLAKQCVDFIAPTLRLASPPVVVDATLGLGGHSELILESHPDVHVIGIDRDAKAIDAASTRLERFGDRFHSAHTTYNNIDQVVRDYADVCGSDGRVQAVLMDLGVSSMQLDDDSRGFAYSRDNVLDMRMNQDEGDTAADLVNSASEETLTHIIRTYGEERFAKRIAQRIIRHRSDDPIRTTKQLADIIYDAIPAATRQPGSHPAKRTFQALRIAVNDELTILADTLPKALHVLCPGGRLVVESYHSLEDRIVKNAMRKVTTVDVPAGVPLTADQLTPDFTSITTKAIQADDDEQSHNSRSKSVRLRVVEKTTPAHHSRRPS